MNKILSFGLFILLFLKTSAFALEVPSLTGPVVDQARFLSEPAARAIAGGLVDLFKREGIQFQVLIINSLQDETLEGYSIKVVDEWKLGKKGDDRAALFLISAQERKMRIEVGRGLEGNLTDYKSKKIIKEVRSLFKNSDYDNGVALGLALMARTSGAEINFDKTVVRARHKRSFGSSFIIFALFGLIMFLQYVFPTTRSHRGFGRMGGYGGHGGFGGGGFGGSSGGSWSGGGGGFAGGGASGDW